MRQAIKVAMEAKTPYGCVILNKVTGETISAANQTKTKGKTAHAELEAIRMMHDLGWEGSDVVLYSTGEPCPMCMGAVIWCGINEVVYGLSIGKIVKYHNQMMLESVEVSDSSWRDTLIIGGVLQGECIDLFENFA